MGDLKRIFGNAWSIESIFQKTETFFFWISPFLIFYFPLRSTQQLSRSGSKENGLLRFVTLAVAPRTLQLLCRALGLKPFSIREHSYFVIYLWYSMIIKGILWFNRISWILMLYFSVDITRYYHIEFALWGIHPKWSNLFWRQHHALGTKRIWWNLEPLVILCNNIHPKGEKMYKP